MKKQQTLAEYIISEMEKLNQMKLDLKNLKEKLSHSHGTFFDSAIRLEMEIREKESYIRGLNVAKAFGIK